MTALKAHEVERYLASPDLQAGILIVYGPDAGLVRETSRRLIAFYTSSDASDSATFELTTLDMSDIEAQSGRLMVEASTSSLFGGKPLIRVRNATKSLAANIGELLSQMPEAIIVIEAGNLLPRDKLRALAEKSKEARTLPCYADSAGSLQTLITTTFSQHQIRVGNDVVRLLGETLGNDREVTRRELEKLCLFAATSQSLTIEDVVTLCGDNAIIATDQILDSCGTGHAAKLESALNRAFAAAVDSQRILISAQNHFLWLRQGREHIAQGLSVSQAMNNAQPRPHFSRRNALEQQLRLWSDTSLGKVGERLSEAILASRQRADLAQSVTRRALLAICLAAARH